MRLEKVFRARGDSALTMGQVNETEEVEYLPKGQLAKNPHYAHHFFHHIFPVSPSQTCTKISAKMTRHCTIENCARLQRRGVPDHCLGSLKTEPNDTQTKRREHPKQRTQREKTLPARKFRKKISCTTSRSTFVTCHSVAVSGQRGLHFCNLTSNFCNPPKSNLLNTLPVTYVLSST